MLVGNFIDDSYKIKQDWFSFGERTQLSSWVHYPKETGQVAGTKIFEELRKSKKKKKKNIIMRRIQSAALLWSSEFFLHYYKTLIHIFMQIFKKIFMFFILYLDLERNKKWKIIQSTSSFLSTYLFTTYTTLLIYVLIYSPIVFRYLSHKFFARRLIYY